MAGGAFTQAEVDEAVDEVMADIDDGADPAAVRRAVLERLGAAGPEEKQPPVSPGFARELDRERRRRLRAALRRF
jgi:HEAT repeat protein